MAEDFGAPIDTGFEDKKSNKTLIIILVVVIVLCCCCVVVGGGGWWLWNNGDQLMKDWGLGLELTNLIL